MSKTQTIQAWHFSNGFLGYGDNRPITQGLSLACDPSKIAMCYYGFHASENILDALGWSPKDINTASLVELGGRILKSKNKHCASIRRHLAVANCERTLHEFAIWCAEQALALGDNPDPRSLKVIAVKRLWLDGQVTDTELDAARATARDAAWDAARATARAAAWDATKATARAAAWDATRAAARATARDAVWDAAWDAARAAARAAAWDAAFDAARDAAWDAARDAAWDAAWDAARDAQSGQLETMIQALFSQEAT